MTHTSSTACLAAALLAAGVLARPAVAELTENQRHQILEEANDAYNRGVAVVRSSPGDAAAQFTTAARRFQQLADDGIVNPKLECNLGNAYLQSGDLGRAILHYRTAQRLSPGDSRLSHNLEYARSLVRSRIGPSAPRALAEALLGWHRDIPLPVRYWAFLAAWTVFWGALGVNMFLPARGWRLGAAAAAVLSIAGGISVASDVFRGPPREGVVLADDVVVRKGNSEGFEPQFQESLHPGVEFRLLESRTGWLLIELPDGKSGWIPAPAAGMI